MSGLHADFIGLCEESILRCLDTSGLTGIVNDGSVGVHFVAGVIDHVKTLETRRGEMAMVNLSAGSAEMMIFIGALEYQELCKQIHPGMVIGAKGRRAVSEDTNEVVMWADEVRRIDLDQLSSESARSLFM